MKVFKSLMVLISMISCITLSGCDFANNNNSNSNSNNNSNNSSNTSEIVVTNNDGFVIEGTIEEGTTLESTKIEVSTQEGISVISSLSSEDYDKSKDVYIYDIHLAKNGSEIQPNGNVKVKIPFSVEESAYYVVFHIKDNSDVERLNPLVDNNYIVFETSSFSYFAVVQETTYLFNATCNEGGTILEDNKEVDYVKGKYFKTNTEITLTAKANEEYEFNGWYESLIDTEKLISKDETYKFVVNKNLSVNAIFTKKVDETTKSNFKVVINDSSKGTIIENEVTVDYSSGKDVASGSQITLTANPESGYALKGWYLVEGTNETLLSCATTYTFTVDSDMSIKAVFDEKVTIQIESHGPLLGTKNSPGYLYFKVKGVTEERSGIITMDVAKGTEVTIDIKTCKGWDFSDWSYRLTDDDSFLSPLTTNAQYTFIASKNILFYAWGNGVPKDFFFTQESINAIYGFRDFKYIEETGTIEKTIKVGTVLQEYIYTDVRLKVYFDDDNESNVECLLNDGFTIEVDKNLDTNKVGRYEIKYIYSGYSPYGPVTLSIFINVVAE